MFQPREVRGHSEKLFMPFTRWEFSNLQRLNMRIRWRGIDNIDGDKAAEVIACRQLMYENHPAGQICMCAVTQRGRECLQERLRVSVHVAVCVHCACVHDGVTKRR